jgi:hypothetical protein
MAVLVLLATACGGGPSSAGSSNASGPVSTQAVAFSHCMRSCGIPNWPDPSTDRNGQPVFNVTGINPDSPRVSNTADACTHLLVQSTTGPTTIQLCHGLGEDGGCAGYGEPPGN